jgi:hypothetical protein
LCRLGSVENTRDLVFPPWRYIAVYEIVGDQVIVLSPRFRIPRQKLGLVQ